MRLTLSPALYDAARTTSADTPNTAGAFTYTDGQHVWDWAVRDDTPWPPGTLVLPLGCFLRDGVLYTQYDTATGYSAPTQEA